MIARKRIRCIVVEVGTTADRRPMARDLLPWADPYVAGLIKKLQDEVRYERRMKSAGRNRLAGAVPGCDDLDDVPFCR